jgi:hypothetical protein
VPSSARNTWSACGPGNDVPSQNCCSAPKRDAETYTCSLSQSAEEPDLMNVGVHFACRSFCKAQL